MNKEIASILAKVRNANQFKMIVNILGRAKKTQVAPKSTLHNVDGKQYLVFEDSQEKVVVGEDYNYIFSKITGQFARWGKTMEEDPNYSPIGPEIADVEISVNGCSGGCSFCYKGNTRAPANNMTIASWKKLLSKFPANLTQVAFGITDLTTNPDFMEILRHTREQGVVPNFTTHGMYLTQEMAKEYASVCGAIAVSCYVWNKNVCYDAIKMLTDNGMEQVNIHCVVSHELMDHAMSVVEDAATDPRLAKLKAIVFLGIKPKGRAANLSWNPVPKEFYHRLVKKCLEKEVGFGFDSCSAPKFEMAMREIEGVSDEQKKRMLTSSESCEANLFSTYVNADGISWACSFTEEEEGFSQVNVIDTEDFMRDVWYSDGVKNFRSRCIASGQSDGCRRCIVFPSINPENSGKLPEKQQMGKSLKPLKFKTPTFSLEVADSAETGCGGCNNGK